jgi:uncharacterized protein
MRAAGLSLLLAWLVVVGVRAAQAPIPPAPTRWVTDTAGFMSAEAGRALDARLEAYERSTGHQLIVYIGQTTGGVPIEEWAVRAFAAWKVGRQGMDDGLVLFIMSDDRRLRIEVGYGLEGQVPDAIAFRIINEVIVPRVQAGDRDGAVAAGMDALVRVISGEGLPSLPGVASPERGPEAQPFTIWHVIIFGIIGIFFLILFLTHPSLAIALLINILASGRRGSSHRGRGWSGGGFGGGFSGGGGRSGGGGASGSW